jgi:hypothetical protein
MASTSAFDIGFPAPPAPPVGAADDPPDGAADAVPAGLVPKMADTMLPKILISSSWVPHYLQPKASPAYLATMTLL